MQQSQTQSNQQPEADKITFYKSNNCKYYAAIGELRREQIVINDIEHIGKESNNLEESEVIGVSNNDYVIYDNKTEQKITHVIKNMTTRDAKRIGLSKMQMFRLKKKVQQGKKIVLKRKTAKKLVRGLWGI